MEKREIIDTLNAIAVTLISFAESDASEYIGFNNALCLISNKLYEIADNLNLHPEYL